MKRLLFFTILFLSFHHTFAQAVLKGRIVEVGSGTPVPFCSVFLPNTTLGISADENGHFEIEIPNGSYEVAIRMIGYETQVFSIQTDNLPKDGFLIYLQIMEVELKAIDVNEDRDWVWYRNLKDFKNYFLGNTENAKSAWIENEKKILLDSDSRRGVLTASAQEPLLIHNPNLGYTLDFELVKFEYDSRAGSFYYLGYPLFIPDQNLSKSKAYRIKKNRQKAYQGSLQHFISSLYEGTTRKEKYQIRRIYQLPNPQKPSRETIRKAEALFMKTQERSIKDSLLFNILNKRHLPDSVEVLEKKPINSTEIMMTTPDGKRQLKGNAILQITYLGEKESSEFLGAINASHAGHQVSKLYIRTDLLELFENGSYSEPLGILVDGYMGWEKVADLMPMDYRPKD
ncbi:carboxypeptidase-like regulatory domain-containing protein [Algoriphagus vanfongensis]|uniref:carboxypeptidase-like regulatory domain-containing protein n=1 Tax=Algoriphagus vanfongensis TaxID=426371 RepID=UPI00041CF2FE|nr:carboxypeptidase-like regulatory domain-containing protein [Algoriphagus vanfongensis]